MVENNTLILLIEEILKCENKGAAIHSVYFVDPWKVKASLKENGKLNHPTYASLI